MGGIKNTQSCVVRCICVPEWSQTHSNLSLSDNHSYQLKVGRLQLRPGYTPNHFRLLHRSPHIILFVRIVSCWLGNMGRRAGTEQNGILIRNNNPDRPRCSLNVLIVHRRRHEGRSRGKSVNKRNLISDQRTQSGAALAARIMRSHQQHFITRGIAKQRAPAPSLFPSHFHFLWFAHRRPRPIALPQPRQILSVLGGEKCWLTAQRQAYLAAWAP